MPLLTALFSRPRHEIQDWKMFSKCQILGCKQLQPWGLEPRPGEGSPSHLVRGQHLGRRFWQARAVESFLRGTTSYADQMFLLKRGLLEVWLMNQGSGDHRPPPLALMYVSS